MTKTAHPSPRRWSTPQAVKAVLILQLAIGLSLVGLGLSTALPHIAFPSSQPQFDTPVRPGDQTRRFAPKNTPLGPAREGNPARPYQSTRDMPTRLNFEMADTTLTLTGQIASADAERLRDYLATLPAPPLRVRLNSAGGSVRDALDIGNQIRAAGFETEVLAGDICLSACPYILAGGTMRHVDTDAQVGVHQHAFGTNQVLPAFLAVEDIQRGQGEVLEYLVKMGVDPLLMRHSLVTPPDEIYVLLPEQLIDYKLSEPFDKQ